MTGVFVDRRLMTRALMTDARMNGRRMTDVLMNAVLLNDRRMDARRLGLDGRNRFRWPVASIFTLLETAASATASSSPPFARSFTVLFFTGDILGTGVSGGGFRHLLLGHA